MAFEGLSDKLNRVFKKLKSRGKLTESDVKEAMREVKLALLEADVSYKVVKDFVAKVSERAVGEEVLKSLTPAQQVVKIVNEELIALMDNGDSRINMPSKPPCIIMMCGLQGSGKTTHAAKLARYFKKEGHRPLLVACDVYRPAAIDQLKVVGEKAGVQVFDMGQIDPSVIAVEGLRHAKDYGNDIVIIDTAGRLHIDEKLMEELKVIKEKTQPNETMLVVDAMTGQDAVNVAKSFDDSVGIDSILMSKLDSDTRGGAALSVLSVTGKPIKFVGMGEKLDEFEVFHAKGMASRILGMGDVISLIERAGQVLGDEEEKNIEEHLDGKSFDMNDLLIQIRRLKRMGSVRSVLSLLPAIGNKAKDIDIDDRQFLKVEAIILSMTEEERKKPSLLKTPKRKRRIAAGSGTKVEDVNRLLKQYEATKTMMKEMGVFGGKGKSKRFKNSRAGKLERNARELLKGMDLNELEQDYYKDQKKNK